MIKGLVFIGGEAPSREVCAELAREAGLIAAADSGLLSAEAALVKAHWIVGDMDSLGDESLLAKYPAECVLRYPQDKDWTDTELAVELLFDKGCDYITLAGGGGGRLDHSFAIFAMFERDRAPKRWRTRNEDIILLAENEEAVLNCEAGGLVSVFPIGEGPWKAESAGLKWPLDGVLWRRGYFGISNIALDGFVSIKIKSGKFLIVREMHL